MKQKHLLLAILSLFISGCNTNNNNQSSLLSDNITQESSEIMHRKTLDMVYNLHTDNNANAKGTIEITPLENSNNLGYYIVYFANDNQILSGYDELISIKSSGKKVSATINDKTYLPKEATKLVAFESTTSFLDDIPSINDANAIVDIKHTNNVELGELKLKFAVASDVHMNYQDYNRGAIEKWTKALDFFYENNAEYIIVTGDMTGDENLDFEYQTYVDIINNSKIDFNNVFECIGNHGNIPSQIGLLNKYLKGNNQIHPYENSSYYHVLIKGKNSNDKDNIFIFMSQELKAPGDTPSYDNFSKEQLDWLENLLTTYDNSNTNVFLIEHSPFLNFAAGDRNPSGYGGLLKFDNNYPLNKRFKTMLENHKNVIMMSGHTHVTLYDGYNYSNENGTFCHSVHVGSTCQPNHYNENGQYTRSSDGRYEVSPFYGSEAYLVEVYDNYILYKGYNLVTKKIIPAGCFLIPTN